jgi:hypothetical protein
MIWATTSGYYARTSVLHVQQIRMRTYGEQMPHAVTLRLIVHPQRSTSKIYHYLKIVTPHEQILFMSDVRVNTSTGLIRQFAPRFNSSVHWESLDNSKFPSNCSGIAFFRNYTVSHQEEIINANEYQISVCMLGNLTETPFKRTRNRQDFNETLYVTAEGSQNVQTTFKLTLSTTLGYFELPNDHLGPKYGPLLDSDPLATCSRPECEPQSNDEPTT